MSILEPACIGPMGRWAAEPTSASDKCFPYKRIPEPGFERAVALSRIITLTEALPEGGCYKEVICFSMAHVLPALGWLHQDVSSQQ
jgi:hypothetical protein